MTTERLHQMETDFILIPDGYQKEVAGQSYLFQRLSGITALGETIPLQQEVFGLTDLEVCPAHMLVTMEKAGGIAVGGWGSNGELVSFAYGWPMSEPGSILLDMIGVREDLRDHGLGFESLRVMALLAEAADYKRIRFTYDPLEARNANFYLRKAGARATGYEVSPYGDGDLAGDRFWAVLDLTSERVAHRLLGQNGQPGFDQVNDLPIAGPTIFPQTDRLLLPIPACLGKLAVEDQRGWWQFYRQVGEHYFPRYQAVEMIVQDQGEQAINYYLFEIAASVNQRAAVLFKGGIMSTETGFFLQTADLYEGCGNRLLIAPLAEEFWSTDFLANAQLRQALAQAGQEQRVDSIMVLTGHPEERESQGYDCTMDVFEPAGNDGSGMAGSWSTMCGNGVRAVARYLMDTGQISQEKNPYRIATRSGIRAIEVLPGDLFRVRMGEFAFSPRDLSRYLNPEAIGLDLTESIVALPLPAFLNEAGINQLGVNAWSMGLHGDRENGSQIDGEPHVVLLLPPSSAMTMPQLVQTAQEWGPRVTKATDFFPQEVNCNFVIVQEVNQGEKKMRVIACTHERGLGDDPAHSVTQACGTGATAIGSTMFLTRNLSDEWEVEVQMPGGSLFIRRENEQYFMVGPANKCD
ncbi:MAG: hypothetical protein JW991_03885 [Candidatus Pacebacteria bacterium]|nr:hypothetical protein [Candidatus Paceibacterota bacterium]